MYRKGAISNDNIIIIIIIIIGVYGKRKVMIGNCMS